MNCIGFPKMFKGNSTIIKDDIYKEKEVKKEGTSQTYKVIYKSYATRQCLYLLLSSEKRDMFGDPEFGIRLKRYMYNQNDLILRDILIDEIYTQITTFCPQIFIDRKNIRITQEGSKLYASITYKSKENFTNDTYNLVLFNTEEEE